MICSSLKDITLFEQSVAYFFFYWVIFHVFCHLIFFLNQLFRKNSFGNNIRVSNSLDTDHARQNVGPDLDPNCLQKLPADDTSM